MTIFLPKIVENTSFSTLKRFYLAIFVEIISYYDETSRFQTIQFLHRSWRYAKRGKIKSALISVLYQLERSSQAHFKALRKTVSTDFLYPISSPKFSKYRIGGTLFTNVTGTLLGGILFNWSIQFGRRCGVVQCSKWYGKVVG